jgi:monoamine oxidase
MGRVIRVTLCFRERFWEKIISPEENKTLSTLSFLFSRDDLFPTWWTQMPEHIPILTGWAPAKSAESLAGMTEDRVIDKALEALSNLLHVGKPHVQCQLVTACLHDWDSDPFSRGAYSYAKAGGDGCQQTLSVPIANTLFLAGEHTDTSGHNGTVHGAIASGHRAAQDILNSK